MRNVYGLLLLTPAFLAGCETMSFGHSFDTPYASAYVPHVKSFLLDRCDDGDGDRCSGVVNPDYFEQPSVSPEILLVHLWFTHKGCEVYDSGLACERYAASTQKFIKRGFKLPQIAEQDFTNFSKRCVKGGGIANFQGADVTASVCTQVAHSLIKLNHKELAGDIVERQCARYGLPGACDFAAQLGRKTVSAEAAQQKRRELEESNKEQQQRFEQEYAEAHSSNNKSEAQELNDAIVKGLAGAGSAPARSEGVVPLSSPSEPSANSPATNESSPSGIATNGSRESGLPPPEATRLSGNCDVLYNEAVSYNFPGQLPQYYKAACLENLIAKENPAALAAAGTGTYAEAEAYVKQYAESCEENKDEALRLLSSARSLNGPAGYGEALQKMIDQLGTNSAAPTAPVVSNSSIGPIKIDCKTDF